MLPPAPTAGTIDNGSLVLVYESHDTIKPVHVTPGACYQNKYGTFWHDQWLGRPYGSKVFGANGNGFVFLLSPTSELWTLALPHRTQILYLADISTVVNFLELRPGSVVLESGTGSGSLTHALARAVAPTGHVYSFEFHAQRARKAKEEVAAHGLASVADVFLRDIEGLGFPEDLAGMADGVFLDLPGPWKVVPSAARSLRPNGVLCSFSPCIEQVQRTCRAMGENGFTELQTIEILLREYEMDNVQPRPFGGQEFGGRQAAKRKAEEAGVDAPAERATESAKGAEGAAGAAAAGIELAPSDNGESAGKKSSAKAKDKELPRVPYAKPIVDARGHTSYMTFARLAV